MSINVNINDVFLKKRKKWVEIATTKKAFHHVSEIMLPEVGRYSCWSEHLHRET